MVFVGYPRVKLPADVSRRASFVSECEFFMEKRVLVDLSATLLHHGHIRLLQKAAELGHVVVGLTTDEEVKKKKGYTPELSYEHRKEILESISYVSEVIPSGWLIDEAFMEKHSIDLLVHGDDNMNHVSPDKIVVFPRTEGVSSSELRERVLDTIISINLSTETRAVSTKLAQMLIQSIKQEFKLD